MSNFLLICSCGTNTSKRSDMYVMQHSSYTYIHVRHGPKCIQNLKLNLWYPTHVNTGQKVVETLWHEWLFLHKKWIWIRKFNKTEIDRVALVVMFYVLHLLSFIFKVVQLLSSYKSVNGLIQVICLSGKIWLYVNIIVSHLVSLLAFHFTCKNNHVVPFPCPVFLHI